MRGVTRRQAEQLIELARGAMVTRQRDLDAFVWADPRDVRLVDCGEGLQFACMGSEPSRRFLLESMYGFLTLKNGVPIGYALASGLMQDAEVAYNVFETFRGGEAAHVYGRLLATVRWLFDAVELTVDPYQLGRWQRGRARIGRVVVLLQARVPAARAQRAKSLVARELARVARNPEHRTPRRTLARLVRDRLYLRGSEAARGDRRGAAARSHRARGHRARREALRRGSRTCRAGVCRRSGGVDGDGRLAAPARAR